MECGGYFSAQEGEQQNTVHPDLRWTSQYTTIVNLLWVTCASGLTWPSNYQNVTLRLVLIEFGNWYIGRITFAFHLKQNRFVIFLKLVFFSVPRTRSQIFMLRVLLMIKLGFSDVGALNMNAQHVIFMRSGREDFHIHCGYYMAPRQTKPSSWLSCAFGVILQDQHTPI